MEAERSSSSPLSGACEIRTDLLIDPPFYAEKGNCRHGFIDLLPNGSFTKASAARGYRFWHHSGVFGGEYW